jgi:single-strand DNA-binding protein
MGSDVNNVLLEGKVSDHPEFEKDGKGVEICRFNIACIRYPPGGGTPEVNFFVVSSRDRLAETMRKTLGKGRQVRVVGRLRQERWDTDQGEKRSKVIIYAENIEFMADTFTKDEKKKPSIRATGDGNIFSITGRASAALRENGEGGLVSIMQKRVTASHSYQEALEVILEYVDMV